jgi:ubiquinone/menaquinone biosynthesis C-methylase UbiE
MAEKPIAAGKSSFNLIDQEKFFSEIDLSGARVLLDAACGAGAYSLALAAHMQRGGTIHAVDLWQEGIETLSREIEARGIRNLRPAVADIARNIPLNKASVDLCLMATVFHDLVEDHTDRGALREIKRVLKKDGLLYVIEFRKIEGPPGPPLKIRLSPLELENALKPYHFSPVRTIDVGEFTYLSIFRSEQ